MTDGEQPSVLAPIAPSDDVRVEEELSKTHERKANGGMSRAERRMTQDRRRRALQLVPPTIAVVVAEVLLFLGSLGVHRTAGFFSPSHWTRFDSGLYLQIAKHGYTTVACQGPAYPPHSVCSTVGWAPLYPGLIAFLGHLGVPLSAAGVFLSILFAYLSLLLVWVLIGPSWSFSRLACLAFAACFPGMVYSYAVFPVSLTTCALLACLLLFIRRRYLWSGILGAVCAWCFSTGALIAVALLLAALLVDRGPDLWRRVACSAGVALGGFLAFLVTVQIWVGNWRDFFSTSAKYGNGPHDPVATFVSAFTGGSPAKYPLQDPNPGYNHLIAQAQTAFIAALVIGLVVWTLWRRTPSRAEWVLLSYTVVFWLAPLIAGPSLSRYRLEAFLLPSVALCTRLPRWVQVVLVGTSAILAVGLAQLFTGSLII